MAKKIVANEKEKYLNKVRPIKKDNINCNHQCISKAFLILKHTHESTDALLKAFKAVRKARGARGASTDEEQDLLRAMLVSAGSGIDAMIKQLFRDALPNLIELDESVAKGLEEFVRRQLRGDTNATQAQTGISFLTRALLSDHRRNHLIDEYVRSLTGSSLQSVNELDNSCNALGIDSKIFRQSKSVLKVIFHTRNQIIHDLDINFEAQNRNRHNRQQKKMIVYSNILLATANSFLTLVSKNFEELEKD